MIHAASSPSLQRVRVERHLAPADEWAVREALRKALAERPRRIPTQYFYDDHGSWLFERICELPEYYQTRAETTLLARIAERVIATSGAGELVELGSGAATKTRILLDAMARAGTLDCYVPVDVSEGIMRRSAEELVRAYPQLLVHGLVADFITDLGALPAAGRRLVAFLGGTIGNLEPRHEAAAFLRRLRASMGVEDFFLVGVDLIKQVPRIEAAYNDDAGVTAAFNRNVLAVVNARFEADFEPQRYRHRAFYQHDGDRIEMRLVSCQAQTVRLAALDLSLELAAGEEILTEISVKFDRARLEALLAAGGFGLTEWFVQDDLFALALAQPVASGPARGASARAKA